MVLSFEIGQLIGTDLFYFKLDNQFQSALSYRRRFCFIIDEALYFKIGQHFREALFCDRNRTPVRAAVSYCSIGHKLKEAVSYNI